MCNHRLYLVVLFSILLPVLLEKRNESKMSIKRSRIDEVCFTRSCTNELPHCAVLFPNGGGNLACRSCKDIVIQSESIPERCIWHLTEISRKERVRVPRKHTVWKLSMYGQYARWEKNSRDLKTDASKTHLILKNEKELEGNMYLVNMRIKRFSNIKNK